METFFIKALQLVLSLSLLVVLHELGHFAFARLFKVRVEKFYMFFNPSFSLVRFKKINGKWQVKCFSPNLPEPLKPRLDNEGNEVKDSKGNVIYDPFTDEDRAQLDENDWRKYPETTEWGIGWLPLGGYCKIAGMVDETTDSDALNAPAQPWEYRAKSVWKRLPIITGGVLVNFISALIIYGMILYTWGKEYLPVENAVYGYQYSNVMLKNGFENGDIMLAVDGVQYEQTKDVVEKILIDGKQDVTVLRQGDTVHVLLPEDFAQQALASGEKGLFEPRFPFVIADVAEEGSAFGLLQKGDSVIAVNGEVAYVYQDVVAKLEEHKADSVAITYVRNGEVKTQSVFLTKDGKLGVYMVDPYNNYLKTKQLTYGFWQSIPAGIKLGWDTLVNYVKQFKLVFTKEGAKSLGGFGAIGNMFPAEWNWQVFWTMTAFLSIILAFMNILPIPALDGGYVLFLLYEIITGKKPGDKFLERANTIGLFLLLALVLYANLNDIIRIFL